MSDLHFQVQPFSDEAEKSILSCFLAMPHLLDEAVESRMEVEFYHPANRLMAGALIDMRVSGIPIELPALATYLMDNGMLDKVGGPAAPADLLSWVPTPAHYPYYRDIIREKWVLRRVIEVSTENIQKCYETGQSEITALLDDVETRTLAIRPNDKHAESDWMRDHVGSAVDAIARQMEAGNGMTGRPTGFRWLDGITKGVRPEMWYIGARPSVGKTSLILQLLLYQAIDLELPVGMFSLEMSRTALNTRMLSLLSEVAFDRIMGGMVSKDELNKIKEAGSKIRRARIYCDDRSGLTASQVRAKARRWKKDRGVQVIYLDFLQRMKASGEGRKNRNQSEEHSENSTSLTEAVKELGIPWFVAAQLNRDCEKNNRMPRLSDFEGCGRIEQDADVALMLSRPAEQPPDEAIGHVVFDIAKQRNGATGNRPHIFRKRFVKFEKYPVTEREEPEQQSNHRGSPG